MANPTTNFGWVMPTATDLVTDLPADFAVFGQGVDTSMAYLLGGTTGQILSKTSATNMAFTWINNDQGDITAVTTTAPLQGGGTSGAIALTVDAASTSASGVVQLSNSTSTTSSVLAATPTAVKSAYDLADAAIAKTTVTTAGDIIYRNATVPTRLGIGTAGQVLTVNSGATAPQWSTPAGGGGMTLLSTITSWNSTSTTISIASGYTNILIIGNNIAQNSDPNDSIDCNFNADASSIYGWGTVAADSATGASFYGNFAYQTSFRLMDITGNSTNKGSFALIINKYTDSIAKNFTYVSNGSNATKRKIMTGMGIFNSTSAISSIKMFHGAVFDAGTTVYVYGVN